MVGILLRKCTFCGELKPINEFYVDRIKIRKKDGNTVIKRRSRCKKCECAELRERYNRDKKYRLYILERNKGWRTKNKVKTYKYKERKRRELIQLLGGKCTNCGEVDWVILEFDHIEPIRGRREYSLLEEVRKYPERFQLLCANCHRKKTRNETIVRDKERML